MARSDICPVRVGNALYLDEIRQHIRAIRLDPQFTIVAG